MFAMQLWEKSKRNKTDLNANTDVKRTSPNRKDA